MTDIQWDDFIIDRFQSQLEKAISKLKAKLQQNPKHKIVIAGDKGSISIGKGRAVKQWREFVQKYRDHLKDPTIGEKIQRNIEAKLNDFVRTYPSVQIGRIPIEAKDPKTRREVLQTTYVWGANFGNCDLPNNKYIEGEGQARFIEYSGPNEVGIVSTPGKTSLARKIQMELKPDNMSPHLAAFYDLSAAENLLRFPRGWYGTFKGDRTKKTWWGPQRGRNIKGSPFLYELDLITSEHQEVYEYIKTQFQASFATFKIKTIAQYENRWRWRQYCRQRGEMELEEGRKFTEHCLFYGCTTKDPAIELEAISNNSDLHSNVADANVVAIVDGIAAIVKKELIVVRAVESRGHKIVYPAFLVTYQPGVPFAAAAAGGKAPKKKPPPPSKMGGKKPPPPPPSKMGGKKPPPPPPSKMGGKKPPPPPLKPGAAPAGGGGSAKKEIIGAAALEATAAFKAGGSGGKETTAGKESSAAACNV